MPVETLIYTIRHGHTSYNAEKRYAGSIDISLSEKGITDCQDAAQLLAGYPFDVVVTSTLKRSIETARLLVPECPTVIPNALCNERNFGIMEGHTWEEILTYDPPILMINVGNDLHTVNPSGGEPFEDVWQRAKTFQQFLFENYEGKNILVISHGVFLQLFHGLLRGRNCIESLASYPSNLELYRFHFCDNHLMGEKVVRLCDKDIDIRF